VVTPIAIALAADASLAGYGAFGLVFHGRAALSRSLVRYYALVGCIALSSYLLIRDVTEGRGAPMIAAKILVDIVL